MTSELELIAKQKNFISKIPWFFSASRNQMISIIKIFCLARYSNSDVIFVFPVVDLYNRILISTWYDDLEKSTSSTVRPKLWRPCGRPRMDLETQIFVCDLRVGPYNKYVWTKTVGPTFNISARPNVHSLKVPQKWSSLCPWVHIDLRSTQASLMCIFKPLLIYVLLLKKIMQSYVLLNVSDIISQIRIYPKQFE